MSFVFEKQPSGDLTIEQMAVYATVMARQTPKIHIDDVSPERLPDPLAAPVGSIAFVRAVAARWGRENALLGSLLPNYPAALHGFMATTPVWMTLGQARSLPGLMFVKPAGAQNLKLFTGQVTTPEQRAAIEYPNTIPVWTCAPVSFMAEYRTYIRHGRVVGMGRYDDNDIEGAEAEPNKETVDAMITALGSTAPAGYALDVGICEGRTVRDGPDGRQTRSMTGRVTEPGDPLACDLGCQVSAGPWLPPDTRPLIARSPTMVGP